MEQEKTQTQDADNIDDEMLLPDHEPETNEKAKDRWAHGWKSARSTVWMVLEVSSTLTARRVLQNGFPYPICFVLLLQITAYCCVASGAFISLIRSLRTTKGKGVHTRRSWRDTLVYGVRLWICSFISGVGVLFGAQALMLYSSLPVLAMLPVFTYICDSLILHTAHILRLSKRDKASRSFQFHWVVLVLLCCGVAVFDDYRLNVRGLYFALAGFSLESLSRTISKIASQPAENQRENRGRPLCAHAWAGIPSLAISAYATFRFENIAVAVHIAGSWSIYTWLINLIPGSLLLLTFNSCINSAFPLLSHGRTRSALEDSSPPAREALTTTLQAGFWVLILGVLARESNLIGWSQIIAFALIYVLAVGPGHIGYYLPRLLNFMARLVRQKQRHVHFKSWGLFSFLGTSTAAFAVLVGIIVMFWVNTIAYNRNAKTWLDPKEAFLDTQYLPPRVRCFDIIIAHSAGHPVESVLELISSFTSIGHIKALGPKITVYTKDSSLVKVNASLVRGDFGGEFHIQELKNIGGIASSYLHYILNTWDVLPVQTLFLSTTKTTTPLSMQLYTSRLNSYFAAQGFPVPDAEPKTGFLNFGEQEVCRCNSCFDSLGWEDTFNLIPSMWSAARPGSPTCDSVLLTYSNTFMASAARIRGVNKDVWKLLYDALMNEDLNNAWAHKAEKLPKMLPGEKKKTGPWAEGGVYAENDSLENPYLGLTVERLWGILLQCSTPMIAWRCPSLWRGSRWGAEKVDCGCID